MPSDSQLNQIIPHVESFFHAASNTISYVVKDPQSNSCAIIDSVLDLDYAAGKIAYTHANMIMVRAVMAGAKAESANRGFLLAN